VQIVSLDGSAREDGGDAPLELAATGQSPDDRAHAARLRGDVERALDALSRQERTVFVMRHYHDMPIRAISSSLQLAEGTVKSMLFRSIRKLRDRLAQYRDEVGDPA
jgi:RNA polymerase sigma-70 factor (ECF subfamily)